MLGRGAGSLGAPHWQQFPYGPAGLKVDHGFLGAYKSVRNATLAALPVALAACDAAGAGSNSCGLLWTGHSLGAAMATLGAAEVADGQRSVTLYTFGSPRVGDKAWAAWAGRRLGSRNGTAIAAARRMRRQKDIVPAIPPRSIGYVHVPTEIRDMHLDAKGHQVVSETCTRVCVCVRACVCVCVCTCVRRTPTTPCRPSHTHTSNTRTRAGPPQGSRPDAALVARGLFVVRLPQADSFVVCDGSGEDPKCGDSEEHPPFPLDLLHLSPAEHVRYLGFQGGNCVCGEGQCA